MPKILDALGQPIPTTPPEKSRVGGALGLNNRYNNYPGRGLTPQKLTRILREADDGQLELQAELFEEMQERDTFLFSQLQVRKLAAIGLEWRIEPADESSEAKALADAFSEMWDDLETEELLLDLLDAILHGVSIINIIWERNNNQWRPATFEHISNRHLIWDFDEKIFKIRTLEKPMGETLPYGATIEHRFKARSGSANRAGLGRNIAWLYLFKHFSLKDWVIFAEVYGQPYRLGKYDAGISEAERNALEQAVRALGSDAAGIISKDTEIEIIQASGRSGPDVYDRLVEVMNREMAQAIVGQTLSSSEGQHGTQALGKVHERVRLDLLLADVRALAATLRRDLIKPFIAFNFGPEKIALAPNLNPIVEEPDDTAARVDVLTKLQAMGLDIPEQWLRETFGVPTPTANDQILKAQQRPAPPQQIANERIALEHTPLDVLNGQQFASDLIEKSANAARAAIAPMLDRALFELEHASGYDDLRARLINAFPDLETKKLAALLENAMLLGQLAGHHAAHEGAQ